MNRTPLPAATKQWYDLDHPLPGTGASPAELESLAATHELHRTEAVAEMIGIIAILVGRGILTGNELVSVGGAVFQFGKGERDLGVAAAHCLPGQIAFDGHPLHTSANWTPTLLANHQLKPLPLASKLRNLGGLTDYVPALLNQADSLIEIMPGGTGLKPAFGSAVRDLMRGLAGNRPNDWRIVGNAVTRAVDHYRRLASRCCLDRIGQLESAVNTPDGPEVLKARIIRRYLATVNDHAFVPLGTAGFFRLVAELTLAQPAGTPPPPA